MRTFLSERNIVVVLFVMVLITFSLAQEDSKKMERRQAGISASATKSVVAQKTEMPVKAPQAVIRQVH